MHAPLLASPQEGSAALRQLRHDRVDLVAADTYVQVQLVLGLGDCLSD